jgi:tumor protein p53-inducible protein 3
MNFVDYI